MPKLTLILGRSGSGKSCATAEKIRECHENRRSMVLIVPEQETVAWETRIARTLPDSVNLYIEVTNFTRLANSVFRVYGGLADTVIDEAARGLVMWRALASVMPNLRVYNSLKSMEWGSVPMMLRAVDELKGAGITPDKLEAAAGSIAREDAVRHFDEIFGKNDGESDGKGASEEGVKTDSAGKPQTAKRDILADRLSDISLVYAAYENILHEEYIDKSDLETKLASTLAGKGGGYFRGKEVFIDSFVSFTAGQERIIEEVLRHADAVTVSVLCDPDDVRDGRTKIDLEDEETDSAGSEYGDGEPQFYEGRETVKALSRIAAKTNAEVKTEKLRENKRNGGSRIGLIEKNLYRENTAEEVGKLGVISAESTSGEVKYVVCNDIYDECEACAVEVSRLLAAGYRCADIGIVTGDVSAYTGIIDGELTKRSYPCYITGSETVSGDPVVKCIAAVLRVIANGWKSKDIICLIKSGMTPLEMGGEAEFLINYIKGWDISSRKTYNAELWSMNPAGYKLNLSENGKEILGIVNAAKIKIVTSIEDLNSVFDEESVTVRQIAEGVVHLAEDWRLDLKAEEAAERFRESGINYQAERVSRGWAFACEILDKICSFLGDTEIDAKKFLNLFEKTAAAMEKGAIPSGIDAIEIASAEGARLSGKKCIIMLGVCEGEFPANPREEKSIFADSERVRLESEGIIIPENDREKYASRQKCAFYSAASSAEEELIIMSHSAGEEPEEVGKIKRITGTGETVYRAFKRRKSKKVTSVEENIEKTTITETKNKQQVKVSSEYLYLSQTKLETYVRCPFMYACRYKMGIVTQMDKSITMPEIGVLIHKILENFFRDRDKNWINSVYESGEYEKISDETVEKIRKQMMLSITENASRIEYLYERIRRHMKLIIRAIIEEMRATEYYPKILEAKIGRGGIKPVEIKTEDGTKIVLEGISDRIDEREYEGKKFARIIDYKTGKKVFKEEELEKGLGLQLPIYAMAVEKSSAENVKIGGFNYVQTVIDSGKSDPDDDEEKANNGVIGRVVFSGISSSEAGIEYDRKSKTTVKTGEEIKKIYELTEGKIREIGKCIYDEVFSADPKEMNGFLPCDTCENAYICGKYTE